MMVVTAATHSTIARSSRNVCEVSMCTVAVRAHSNVSRTEGARERISASVGDARQHLGPEQLDGFHQAVVRHEAVVHPREDPPDRQALEQMLELARHGVHRADEREAVAPQICGLAGFRIVEALGKSERLEPFVAAEITALAPDC